MNGPLVFRKDLIVSQHDEGNGQKSAVIKNPVTDQFFYMSMREYLLLKALDGQKDLDQARQSLTEQGCHYSKNEAAEIVERASYLGLILGSPVSSASRQLFLKKRLGALKRARKMMAPLSLYIPLVNPDAFLNRTLAFVTLAFNGKTLPLWFSLALGSLYVMLGNIDRIADQHLALLSTRDFLMILPVVAATRLAHELGHAYAAKAFGLEVKALGIAFLVLFPCPYIDTTDAWKLSSRRQRMIIGAAGIMAEMIMACISVFIWFFSKPGILNYLCFYVMTVSTLSTLLFNGNPLMKFDGYFILSDYLRLPNLAPRSLQYLKALVTTKFLGVSFYSIPEVGLREALIFVTYGVSSVCYRITLYAAIIAGLYYRFDKFLGLGLATYAVVMLALKPLSKGVKELWVNRSLIKVRRKTLLRAGSTCGFIGVVMLWPWSQSAKFPCRIDSPDVRAITIPVNSIVTNVFIREGARLVKGQKMFELDTTVLEFELRKAKLQKEVIELQMKTLSVDIGDLAKVPQKSLELSSIEEVISRMENDLRTSLESTTAPFDAIVTQLDRRLKPGFQAAETTTVGYLKATSSRVALASIPDRLLGKIVPGQQAQVRVPWEDGRQFTAAMRLSIPCPELRQRHPIKSGFQGNVGPRGMHVTEPESKPISDESHYVWTAELHGAQDIPLGMTGTMTLAFPPENLASRIYGYVARTANRESFF